MTKDLILFSTADWDNPFWTNKQHMAVNFADDGFRVLYIESVGLRKPVAGGRDLRRIIGKLRKAASGLRKVRNNIWVCTPLVIPLHGSSLIRRINRLILLGMIRKHCRTLAFDEPVFWTYNPLSREIAREVPHSLTVYHCVDDLSSAPGMPSEAIRCEELKLLEYADLIFTTSPRLQERCAAVKPLDSHFFPNVVDFDHFSKAAAGGPIPDDLARIPGPRIGFIGAISSYKVDFELIARVARLRPEWNWVLIGAIGEGQPETTVEALKEPNIHLLGPKDYSVLPDYLRAFDIAVIPSPINDYTVSMFPMKFFEYLAAEKPVISTELPSLWSYRDVCRLVKSAEEFVLAADGILKEKPGEISKGREIARKHTWQWRMGEMLPLLSKKWSVKQVQSADK